MNAAITQTQTRTGRAADRQRPVNVQVERERRPWHLDVLTPLRFCARVAGTVAYAAFALVASVAAIAAAVLAVPFLLLAPVAVVGLAILVAAYVLSGAGLI